MDINTIWFILIGVLLAIYSATEGFDLGCGMLHLFSKSEAKKHLLTKSIAPVWDVNEVWLIAALGGMFAAFPNAYSTVFSGFYLAVILLLMAIIFRAISLEVRAKIDTHAWRKGWDFAFGFSSLLIALLLGVALGNVFLGIPLDATLDTNIGFFGLLRPYPIVMGLAVVATFFLHGNLFAYIKAPNALIAEFKKTITPAVIAVAIIYLALVAMTILQGVNMVKFGALAAVIAVVLFIALLLIPMMIKQDKNHLAFILSLIFIVGNMVLVMIGMFPNMVNDINMVNPITIYNGSSSAETLKNMLIIAGIGVPIVIAYTIFVYRVFRGRITD